jgi:hypothetical protein
MKIRSPERTRVVQPAAFPLCTPAGAASITRTICTSHYHHSVPRTFSCSSRERTFTPHRLAGKPCCKMSVRATPLTMCYPFIFDSLRCIHSLPFDTCFSIYSHYGVRLGIVCSPVFITLYGGQLCMPRSHIPACSLSSL